MDIQFVLNAYACIMYVASYIMKTEMGELLKHSEIKDFSVKGGSSPAQLSFAVFLLTPFGRHEPAILWPAEARLPPSRTRAR